MRCRDSLEAPQRGASDKYAKYGFYGELEKMISE